MTRGDKILAWGLAIVLVFFFIIAVVAVILAFMS